MIAQSKERLALGSLFALKFCKHRWLENVLIAECTQSMWDSVVKYVQSAMAVKVPQPHNNSFQTIREVVADPFTTAKVAFFLSVAKRVMLFFDSLSNLQANASFPGYRPV